MRPEEALKTVVDRLEEAKIDYMITGSFASNLHGVPRATNDADVVIEVSSSALGRFLELIEGDFYVSREAAKEALIHRRIFNVIHFETGFKVDLIVRKNRGYSIQEFRRRQWAKFLDRECWFTSPEDAILSKLEWSKAGGSERQFQDALGVAQVQGRKLDRTYLEHWARELDLLGELRRLFEELPRD